MYRDLISYELAEGITESHLFKVAQEVYDQWMSKQPGFVKWELLKDKDGSYVDIVYWESKEAAKASEQNMGNIPNGAEWFACYKKGSISSRNVEVLKSF